MSDAPTLNNKAEVFGKWDMSNPKWINGILCGTKTFDLTDKNEREKCANEIVCRKYLNDKNFSYITRTGGYSSDAFKDDKKLPSCDDIQKDFDSAVKKADSILSNLDEVFFEIYIEIETKAVNDIREIPKNYLKHEENILNKITEIFELVSNMKDINFVHGDLKPENFLFKIVEGKAKIILNDFDVSYVLPPDRRYKETCLGSTYPAPELVKVNKKPGYWTDVFVAGTMAYELLNNGKLPDGFEEIYLKYKKSKSEHDTEIAFKELNNDFNSLFKKIKRKGFKKPANADDKLWEIISTALSIKPEERQTADKILIELQKLPPTKIDTPKHIYTPPSILPDPFGDNRQRNYMLALVAIIIFCVTIIAIVVFSSGKNNITNNISLTNDFANDTTFYMTNVTSEQVISTSKAEGLTTIISSRNTTGTDTLTVKTHQITTKANDQVTTYTTINEVTSITEPTTEQPIIPQLEYSSSFKCDSIELSGNINGIQLFPQTRGIVITGYNDENNIPPTLEIPSNIDGEPVICIGEGAFSDTNIKELYIPDSIIQIDSNSFSTCNYLEHIELGTNVKYIGEDAFFKSNDCCEHAPQIIVRSDNFGELHKHFGERWAGTPSTYQIFNTRGEELSIRKNY